jgi:hypothetical protein
MAKGKKAVKKAIKQIARPKAVSKAGLLPKLAIAARKAAPAVIGAAIGAGAAAIGSRVARGRRQAAGGRRRYSAKQLLKKAYETRARRQVRQGMLGHARRTLRKKATVV